MCIRDRDEYDFNDRLLDLDLHTCEDIRRLAWREMLTAGMRADTRRVWTCKQGCAPVTASLDHPVGHYLKIASHMMRTGHCRPLNLNQIELKVKS